MKNPWVIIAVFTVVLFGGAIWLSGQASTSSNEGVEIKSYVKGNPDATVKLVEYSDFQCPACAAFQPVVKTVLYEYGDQISFEYKHFPLSNIHPHALAVAMAVEAAGQQGKFYEFHDRVFETQSEWSGLAVINPTLISIAEELGLNVEQFKDQMRSSVLRDKVKSEFDEGRGLGVTGTPTFFLNGQKMQYDSYEAFLGQIADAVNPNTTSSEVVGEDVKFGL